MIRYTVRQSRPQRGLDATCFHRYQSVDGTVWTEFYRAGEGYLLRFPELADFEVSRDGKVVVAHPGDTVDAATVEHLYTNQLMPLALSRQGRAAFHASVVTVAGGAIAFLGESGAGKSTLAASFALHGSAFLTDDALVVEEIDGGCRALPGHASLRLWDDSVKALVGAAHPQMRDLAYSSKTRLSADEALAHSDKGQPLRAAFVLQPQGVEAINIYPLRGMERFMSWVGHSFLLDIEDRALLSRHFEWTHRIADAVPTFSLGYPHNYDILSQVRSGVQRHMAEHDI